MAISAAIHVGGGISSGVGRSYSHMSGLTWSLLEESALVTAGSFRLDEVCTCTGRTNMLPKSARRTFVQERLIALQVSL